ncbi:hypothetical protein BJ166DRAFT_59581 [Pestalotiopsis sp. NC0098]|nr:hypothetical protein BJ166DRAFT_59581 [Pestalotiopsis sp. NC0098]
MHFSILSLGLLPLAVQAAPAPQGTEPPQPGPGVPNMGFELYAYGSDFGGLNVFNWNGLAFLGNASLANDTEAAEVQFMRSPSSTTTMTGNPVPGPGSSPSWSNVTYYIPADTTTSHQTGFLEVDDITTDDLTTGFVFYGNTAAWEDSTGALQTKWYALPYGDTNLWTLNWDPSTESSSDKVQVTLRTVTPSRPPPNPPSPQGGQPGGPPASS